MLITYLIPVLLISSTQLVSGDTSALEITPADDRPQFCDMVRELNYTCYSYKVVTEDGYILTLYHIPRDSSKVVLFVHGFLDSAITWVLRGVKSLPKFLADNGYDLWFANTRGNMLSRNHTTLNPDLPKFWEFSFHEMALFDVPAHINFVLNKTGQTEIQMITHSQGTSLIYVLGSLKPEYCSIIKHTLSLAPIAYLHHAQKPLFPLVSLAGGPLLSGVVGSLGHGELLRNSSVLSSLFQLVCTEKLIGTEACRLGVAAVLFGPDPEQFEEEFAQRAFKYYPAGSSVKNLIHLAQIVLSKEFQQYDYGAVKNLKMYNSIRPPVYNLNKVACKVSLYYARNDRLSSAEDVALLRNKLPHVEGNYDMSQRYLLWNHVDYVWGKYMEEFLFGPVLEGLTKNN